MTITTTAKSSAAPLGQLSLPALMEQAGALQAAGQPAAAAELYARWVAESTSPLRHMACFNWGTALSAAGQQAEAEAAYRRALDFAPALPRRC